MKSSRINIRYDIETENGTQQKELPFVVGIISDLSGSHPGVNKTELHERTFHDVTLDNIDSLMQQLLPGIQIAYTSCLTKHVQQSTPITLQFSCINDFSAEAIAKQIPELEQLITVKQQLKDLLSKINCSRSLERQLEKLIATSSTIKTLAETSL